MRLFIGIDLGHLAYFSRLQEPLRNLQGARMTFPSSFHLTLRFIGDVDEPAKNRIDASLQDIRFTPFTLCCDHIGAFPSPSRARVVWAGFAGGPGSGKGGAPFKEGYDSVVSLARQVESALKGLHISGADQSFMPHVTLARIKTVEEGALFAVNDLIEVIKVPAEGFTIPSFSLIKSSLGRDGPAYETLAHYPSNE